MSDVKSRVAAMMQLPRAERLEALVAMSKDLVSREQDAAPLLELIQLELNSPDTPPGSRPATGASSVAIAKPPPREKSMRRQLTEKRNELRAMLAQVDRALGPSSASGTEATIVKLHADGTADVKLPNGEVVERVHPNQLGRRQDAVPPSTAQSSRPDTGASRSGGPKTTLTQAEIDALLRRAEGGGKAQVRGAIGYQSSLGSIL